MKVVRPVVPMCVFSLVPEGNIFEYSGEIYLKIPVVYQVIGQPFNSILLRDSFLTFVEAETIVIPHPDAELRV